MVLDVKRAFLYGDIEEEIYIELPDEDERKKDGYVGWLKKAMYGTRSAPLMWQKMVKRAMAKLKFDACMTVHCLFFHRERERHVRSGARG